MEQIKLDKKDYKILRELDKNYRTSFSKIAKEVKLSKSSVINRFENKIKAIITHSSTGINNEKIGYKIVKVYYSLNYYDKQIEKTIIKELKDHPNILWIAKYHGPFDVSIALLVKNFNQLINHLNSFNETLIEITDKKRIELVFKQFYFRHDYLHEKPTKIINIYESSKEKKEKLSKTEKKIISSIINEPRKSILKISEETNLSIKTITTKLKELEKRRIITGYFITIDNTKLNYDTFKLMIQIKSKKEIKKFESYLLKIKNIRHITKMIGYWDYEIDLIYKTNKELHREIENIRRKFPEIIRKIDIASFEKRIFTNKNNLLFH